MWYTIRDRREATQYHLLCPTQAKKKKSIDLLLFCVGPVNQAKHFSVQDLKARLKEEISRVQSAITDERSEDNKDGMRCELEVTALILHA